MPCCFPSSICLGSLHVPLVGCDGWFDIARNREATMRHGHAARYIVRFVLTLSFYCCASTIEGAGSIHELDWSHRGGEFVPAREWMLIRFELSDLLKAHKKGIRRAAVNSFDNIAQSLGSQDVLSGLRSCACRSGRVVYAAPSPLHLSRKPVDVRHFHDASPLSSSDPFPSLAFTCLPAILNEYCKAELNVRTGCLKALSLLFEYVGPQSESAYYADSVVTIIRKTRRV
ncbi:hypothetical protein BV25DRAFT_1956165 [Artomyces pyxidatus]|uniref:Uncharacterized protein n=1 Tax=Artomyces pyxidatus TaxID=48021 RepID=A0ACB8SVL9_9AGAM|nr:hypothetical protein BV25DRAFT_1956165 [Artomyces pyxidatus]